tara:strand:- start:163 stop:693 length:531 start_codon:yes stop_codon:yes gene_type:complete
MLVKLLFIFLTISILHNNAFAKLSEEENSFLSSQFNDQIPKKKRLIVKKDTKVLLQKIMGDKYNKRIFSYWQKDNSTIWILNSIGKYKPITAGFVIQDCKIKSSHVLVYREQIGYEIKYPNFLLQFTDAELNSNIDLNIRVDNISGATLSVNSMERMVKASLLLNKLSDENTCNKN